MIAKIFKASVFAALIAASQVGEASAQSKWTGVSLGVGVGAGAINHNLLLGPGPAVPPGTFSAGFDGIGGEGVLGTVGVALDYQMQRIVIGAFFDYDFASLDTEMNLSVPPLGGLNVTGKISLDNQWTIGGRVGVLLTPDTLWYALAGYTRAEISDLELNITGPAAIQLVAGVPSFSGFVVGGGVETMLAPNWSIKAEYRYTELDAKSLDLPLGLNAFVDAQLEPSIHTARLSLNYKFNFDRSSDAAPLK